MKNLDNIEIYANDKNQYQLTYFEEEGFIHLTKHEDLIGYAFLYAFYSENLVDSLLSSPKLDTEEDIWYSSIKREEDGSIIVLLINKDFDGGVCVYEDWRDTEKSCSKKSNPISLCEIC